MKPLLTIVLCLLLTLPVLAKKPVNDAPPPASRIPCGLVNIVYDWDFAAGDQGFTTEACDPAGGGPLWEHGATTWIPDAPADVWGTVLNGDYITDGGESLVCPTFTVDAATMFLEITHYYDAENLWDGGNVTVNGQEIAPLAGYPGMISVPGDWHAWCVDFEMGFTGTDSGWLTSCFDLSPFIGEEVTVRFDFGSDDTVVEAGWYIAAVRVGNDQPVPVESRSLGEIKGMFR